MRLILTNDLCHVNIFCGTVARVSTKKAAAVLHGKHLLMRSGPNVLSLHVHPSSDDPLLMMKTEAAPVSGGRTLVSCSSSELREDRNQALMLLWLYCHSNMYRIYSKALVNCSSTWSTTSFSFRSAASEMLWRQENMISTLFLSGTQITASEPHCPGSERYSLML